MGSRQCLVEPRNHLLRIVGTKLGPAAHAVDAALDGNELAGVAEGFGLFLKARGLGKRHGGVGITMDEQIGWQPRLQFLIGRRIAKDLAVRFIQFFADAEEGGQIAHRVTVVSLEL